MVGNSSTARLAERELELVCIFAEAQDKLDSHRAFGQRALRGRDPEHLSPMLQGEINDIRTSVQSSIGRARVRLDGAAHNVAIAFQAARGEPHEARRPDALIAAATVWLEWALLNVSYFAGTTDETVPASDVKAVYKSVTGDTITIDSPAEILATLLTVHSGLRLSQIAEGRR